MEEYVLNISRKINDSLYLVNTREQGNEQSQVLPTEVPCHHVMISDVSGSMSYDLPKVREHLKARLPSMVRDNDTVTIIWFSGRSEFGVLMEGEKVATLKDLKAVNEKIDRWLRPVGLTGFKEPLVEASSVIDRLTQKFGAGYAVSLSFMTDGADNCWSQDDILKAVDAVSGKVSSAVFVEYGYYANRPLLTKMAERAGGSLIHSDGFVKYESVLKDVFGRRPVGGKKKKFTIPNTDVVGGIAYALVDGDISTFAIDAGSVMVPEGVDSVWFLSPTKVGVEMTYDGTSGNTSTPAMMHAAEASSKGSDVHRDSIPALYAAISLFATRMKPEVVRPLLKASGDVKFINQYANCFGKQAYSTFMDDTKKAAFDKSLRWTAGFDPNKVPADDAFTVLDMLYLLSSNDKNKVLTKNPAFNYSRIGRATVDANTVLTDDEQAEVEALTAKLSATKDLAEIKKITAQIEAITNKPEALKFEEVGDGAYAISNLTFSESRPNISILLKKPGTVSLASRKDKPEGTPEVVETHIHRNYTIIKDGLVNMSDLPCHLSEETTKELQSLVKEGKIAADVFSLKGRVVNGNFEADEVIIHLDKLPVINANMVKTTSAVDLFTAEYKLLKAKAAQKVYNGLLAEKRPGGKVSAGLSAKYSPEVAAYLKEQGITDGGFAPKRVQAEAVDFYMAKEMDVKVAGLSALPSLKDVRERIKSNKLTASAGLMAEFVTSADGFITGLDDEAASKVLEAKASAQKSEVRAQILAKAKTLFSVIVGNAWFKEFSSLDENSMTLKFDGKDFNFTVEMSEKKETI